MLSGDIYFNAKIPSHLYLFLGKFVISIYEVGWLNKVAWSKVNKNLLLPKGGKQ
jgi:hypothetical protein